MFNPCRTCQCSCFDRIPAVKKQAITGDGARTWWWSRKSVFTARAPYRLGLSVKICGGISRCIELFAQLLRLRQQPIVHGDIKPSNIVFDQQSRVLSDWLIGFIVFAQIRMNRGILLVKIFMDFNVQWIAAKQCAFGDIYFIGEETT